MCCRLNFRNILGFGLLKRKFSVCQASSIEPFFLSQVKKSNNKARQWWSVLSEQGTYGSWCRAAGAASTARLVPLLLPLNELRYIWSRGSRRTFPLLWLPRNSGCSCEKVALKGLELGAEILYECNSVPMVPTHWPFEEHRKSCK